MTYDDGEHDDHGQPREHTFQTSWEAEGEQDRSDHQGNLYDDSHGVGVSGANIRDDHERERTP